MLDKSFDPKSAEPRLYAAWEEKGYFKPEANPDGEPFTIVIPPPNVTGSLHMGHALNNTLQDVLCRFERMRGRAVLWQPGTDHAGIATQMVVERQLAEHQQKRTDFSRDEFVAKVWEWRHESGGQIINQLKRLGASCDWSRECFTMGENGDPDDQMVRAVMKTFVKLYNDGLIYRDKRLVNWDPKFETAISDLEVENSEVDGQFWHFKYPLAGGETYEYVEKDEDGNVTLRETRDYISIATTRPETMLGDGAVAVHPSDERYAPIVGKLCEIPVGPKAHRRLIPIITDDYPDPDFGSGAVKITGAHDTNDYDVAKRNNIPLYRLMDTKAQMRADGAPYADEAAKAKQIVEEGGAPDAAFVDGINLVPDEYRGLDRFEARKRVVADIDADGLMIRVEDKKIMQPFGDRSGVVIEPMLTDQWFVNAEHLARRAIEAVEKGETRFIPSNWEKTYFQWMRNIEPWCISRQLWWGHRIPAWYGPELDEAGNATGHEIEFVAENHAEIKAKIMEYYGRFNPDVTVDLAEIALPIFDKIGDEKKLSRISYRQDHDVLDTWFSSGLWPFSTLGWPDETAALKKHYPNSTLVTAFDIIFFWVARMMMQGLYIMDDVPFKDVYIHALVLDEHGQKMSKSKGNVIDPLGLVDKYGADPLRFTLAAMAAQGRNIRLSESRIEGYRNFSTKLWNAARFTQMNECAVDPAFDPAAVTTTFNKWIVHEANACAGAVTRELEAYRFNDAASAIYKFTWNIFCDWALEIAKPIMQGPDGPEKAETQKTIAWALDQILKLLHPFMPFVTEELWGGLATRDEHLVITAWPTEDKALESSAATAEMTWTIDLITAIRSVRAEMNVPAGAKISMLAVNLTEGAKDKLSANETALMRLARLDDIKHATTAPKGAVQIIHDGMTYALPLADVIDLGAEKGRLQKAIAKAEGDIAGIDKKLANENFVAKAPPAVVEEQKTRRADLETELEKLKAAFTRLEEL
ncbi:MAG: valine--tRNA ligase [Pseudomonadota bacterium]